MSTPTFGLDDTKALGSEWTGIEADVLFRIIDAQLGGALRVLRQGVVNGLTVTAGSGLSVNVSSGSAISLHSSRGPTFLRSANSVSVPGLTDGILGDPGITWIYALPTYRTGPTEAPDSRETTTPVFVVSGSSSLDGGVLLARVECVAGVVSLIDVTDRQLFPVAKLQADLALAQAAITALQDDIGYPYDEEALGTIAARLDALETGGGGGGGGGTTYWGTLVRSAVNGQTVEQLVDSKIAAAQAATQTSPVSAIPQASEAQAAVYSMIDRYAILCLNNSVNDQAPTPNRIVGAPGRGHCLQSDVLSPIDYENSDVAIIDEAAHVFRVAS